MARRQDPFLQQAVGNLLRVGVSIAALIVLAGAFLLLVRHGLAPVPNYHTFAPPAGSLRSLSGIFRGALSFDPMALIQFGLLVLIATPVLRVCVSLLGFALERDWTYVAITALVLGILAYSLAGGRGL